MALYWATVQPFSIPLVSEPPQVDPARLELHVRKLSLDLYPRSFDHPGKLNAAASYIRDQFLETGGDVSEQWFPVEESKYRNIIVRFGPRDGPVLVIGAHYDSYGDEVEGAKLPRGYSPETHTPGADDNASGVAGLIELARLLGKHPPSRAVELVAYALEEPPHFRTEHMGSVWHARELRKEKRQVTLMLSLEMIGYFSDEKNSQNYPVPGMGLVYPSEGNFIAVIGRLNDWSATRRVKAAMSGATNLPVWSMNSLALIPGVDFSDHRNYWAEDMPALMITDTAFYRNPNYHLGGDTYERLDFPRMAKVVQGVFAVAQSK